MTAKKPAIPANICEIDGPYYPVRLHVVPQVGDFIDLTSFRDIHDGHDSRHAYEVVAVKHEIYEYIEGDEHAGDGHHFVSVFVKKSSRVAVFDK